MRLILLSLLLSINAYAEQPTEMYMPNDAGGFVVLTAEPCPILKVSKDYPYRAYATEASDIVFHEGCWDSPNVTEVPTELLVKEEGAGPAPTIRAIAMVNTWWKEGGVATFRQTHFTKEKKRINIDTTLKPIIVTPEK